MARIFLRLLALGYGIENLGSTALRLCDTAAGDRAGPAIHADVRLLLVRENDVARGVRLLLAVARTGSAG